MRGCTNDWAARDITMQVADVHKPLCAMSKVCKAGHRIILDDDGSYIQHKRTGEKTELKQKNGVYVLQFWVPRVVSRFLRGKVSSPVGENATCKTIWGRNRQSG